MQRTLDNFQELGWCADNGKLVRTASLTAEMSVSISKKWEVDDHGNENPAGYKATMIFISPRTQETLAIYERMLATSDALLELLGIDDDEEIWEVLD